MTALLLIASHFAAASLGAGFGALAVALVSINRDSRPGDES